MATTSSGDVVEKEVRIAARPETIFSFFTDPALMVKWKGIEATLDPKPGGVYRVSINGRDVASGAYVEVVPHTRVVFTWGWEGEGSAVPPGTSTVEITLVPDGAETIVRLRPPETCPRTSANSTARAGTTSCPASSSPPRGETLAQTHGRLSPPFLRLASNGHGCKTQQ